MPHKPHPSSRLVIVWIALGHWVIRVEEHAVDSGGIGIGCSGPHCRPGKLGVIGRFHTRQHLHIPTFGGDNGPQSSGVVGKTTDDLHADQRVDDPLLDPGLHVHPHALVAVQGRAYADHQPLGTTLLCGGPVADPAYFPHPLGQGFGVLGDFPAADKRRVVVHVQLNAVAGVISDQLGDHRQPVCPYFGYGKGQPVGVVEAGLGVFGLFADLPFGMLSGEVGHPAIGDAVVRRVNHVQQQAGQKLKTALLRPLAHEHERVNALFDHQLGVVRRPPPNIVVGQVDVVPPALAHLGGVEQNAAVAHGIGNGINAEVDQLVDGL